MMRRYETMFILNPTFTEEEQTAQVEAVRAILVKHDAVIKAEHNMGVRNLAYAINKFDRGYYHVIYFEAPTAAINFLEKFYKVTESIFRFIVVKYENQSEIKAWETMVKKASGEKVEEKMIKTRERSNYKRVGDRNAGDRYSNNQGSQSSGDRYSNNQGSQSSAEPARTDKASEATENTQVSTSTEQVNKDV